MEISLFLVTDPLKEGQKEVKKDEKELFSEFVHELFNNNGRKYLNSVNKVSSTTGIPLGQIKGWFNMLLDIKMRGNRNLICKDTGGYVSSFPVSTVLSVAQKALFTED